MSDPVRTCIGCRSAAPKRDLLRFVAKAGDLVHDPTGTAPGRGVYTCRSADCFERAQKRDAFARGLRKPVRVGSSVRGVYERG